MNRMIRQNNHAKEVSRLLNFYNSLFKPIRTHLMQCTNISHMKIACLEHNPTFKRMRPLQRPYNSFLPPVSYFFLFLPFFFPFLPFSLLSFLPLIFVELLPTAILSLTYAQEMENGLIIPRKLHRRLITVGLDFIPSNLHRIVKWS